MDLKFLIVFSTVANKTSVVLGVCLGLALLIIGGLILLLTKRVNRHHSSDNDNLIEALEMDNMCAAPDMSNDGGNFKFQQLK